MKKLILIVFLISFSQIALSNNDRDVEEVYPDDEVSEAVEGRLPNSEKKVSKKNRAVVSEPDEVPEGDHYTDVKDKRDTEAESEEEEEEEERGMQDPEEEEEDRY